MRHIASTITISFALALPGSACDGGDSFGDIPVDSDGVTADAEPDAAPADGPAELPTLQLPAQDDEPVYPEDLWNELDPAEIIDGVVWDSDRDVMVIGVGTCTGTLLRNNVVLTAKHCVSTDGTINGPELDPQDMTARQDGPGATLGATRSVTAIARMPTRDVALLRLSSGFVVDGRSFGQSTQVLATAQSDIIGQVVLCQGYGRDTCEGGSGTLRAGLVEVAASNGGMLSYVPWLGLEWIQWKGDSGSSCKLGQLNPATLQKALGVASTAACGTVATEVGPQLYRGWAVDQMNAWAGGTSSDTFSWPFLYDVEEPGAMIAGPTQWQVSGGVLTENSNAYTNLPSYEGSRYLNRSFVASDAFVRITVSSADDDAAGLIMRYRDATHYYRLSFDEQRRYARIVRRSGNTWTVIAENVDFDIDWSSEPEIAFYASGSLLGALVDGQLVLLGFDDQDGYTAGRVGVYTWGLAGATFDDLEVERF